LQIDQEGKYPIMSFSVLSASPMVDQ